MKKILNLIVIICSLTLLVSCALSEDELYREPEPDRTGPAEQTAGDRYLTLKKDESQFKMYSATSSDQAWKDKRNRELDEMRKMVDCEQSYLKKLTDVEKKCSDYNFNLDSSNDFELAPAVANSVIMRHYLIYIFLEKKEYKKAEKELVTMNDFYDNTLCKSTQKNILGVELVTNMAAQKMRLETVNVFIEYLKAAKRTTDIESWTAKRDKYSQDVKSASLRYANQAYKKRQDNSSFLAEQAAIAKVYTDLEKEEKERNERIQKNYSSGGFDFQGALEASAESESTGAGGACTCVKREQYWVAGRSASGLVKAQLGHHEYRDVKVACPCTK